LALALLAPVASAGVDDYPANLKNRSKDAIFDPWRFYNRECTSFVAWRLNKRNKVGFTNYYRGQHWGNANHWDNAARALGISINGKPAVGAVAQTDAGWGGHVAWVESVNSNGTVTIEEYNGDNTGHYSEHTVSKSSYSYIHIRDIKPKPKPKPKPRPRPRPSSPAPADTEDSTNWLPLRAPAKIGCVKDNCGGYHGYWAVDFLDPARATGDGIYAAGSGRVVARGSYGFCLGDSRAAIRSRNARGNWVEVDHGGGVKTRYFHLKSISVSIGQSVTTNTKIGTMGNTGASTCRAPHLHFEKVVNGVKSNPGALYACHGSRKIGYSNWNARKGKLVYSDGVGCGAPKPAPNPASGPGTRIAIRKTDGQVVVKEGPLNATWATLADSAAQVELSGDRIAVRKTNGAVVVKEGPLNATWATLADSAAQVELSGDRIAVRKTNGAVVVKEGPLNAGWATLADSAAQVELGK
jgi:surface antigen